MEKIYSCMGGLVLCKLQVIYPEFCSLKMVFGTWPWLLLWEKITWSSIPESFRFFGMALMESLSNWMVKASSVLKLLIRSKEKVVDRWANKSETVHINAAYIAAVWVLFSCCHCYKFCFFSQKMQWVLAQTASLKWVWTLMIKLYSHQK